MARVLTDEQGSWLGVAAWLVAAATAVACGGKQMNVGDDQPMAAAGSVAMGGATGVGVSGSGASSAAPTGISAEDLAQIQWPPAVACTPAPGSKLVGTWKGHWPEALGGVPNSDVVLTISGLTPDGVPCGTVKIGAGPQPPPVTDANAIYPPSLGAGGGVGRIGPVFTDSWPGYEYQILHVQSTPTRLAFGVSLNEVLRPWCQQQVAYPESFTCLPAWQSATGEPGPCTISGPGLAPMTVPCFKIQFCSASTCFCYEGQCDASVGNKLTFELHWDGAALEGSVSNQLIFLDPVAP